MPLMTTMKHFMTRRRKEAMIFRTLNREQKHNNQHLNPTKNDVHPKGKNQLGMQ